MFGLGRKRKKKSKSPPPRAPSGCAVPPHVDANSLGLGLPEDVDLTEGFQAHPPKGKLSPAGSPEKPSDELASSIRAELEANLSWPFEKGTFKGTLEANGAAGLLTLSRCLEFHLWKAVDNWIEVCADAPERVAYAIESLRMSERTLELMAASYAGEVPEVGDEHEVADAMERAGAIADAIGTTARAVLVGASEGQNGGAAASEDDDDAPPPTRLSEKGMAPLDRRLRERLRRAAQRECDAFLGRAVARFHEKEQEQCELMLALLEQTEFERIKFERRNSSNAEDNKNNRAVGEAASIKGVMYKVGSGTNLIYEPRWFVIEPTADTLYLAYYKRGSLRRRLDLVDAVDVREAEERASAVFFAERRTLPPGATQFRTIQLEMRSNVDGSDHTSVFHLCSPTEHDFWLSVITKAFLLLEPIRQLKYAEQATPLPNNADGDGDGEGEAADTAFGWRMRAALGKMRHGVKDQAKPVGVTALDARRKAPSEGAANVQQLTSNIAQNRDGLQRLRGLSDADSASGPSSRRGSQRYNRASSGGTAVDCNAIEEEERAGTPSPHFDGAKPGEKSAKPALELVFMLRACTSLVDRCDVVLRRAALLPRELGVAELAYAAMEADFCAWLNPYLPFLHEEEDKSRVAMAAAQAIRMGDLAERIGAAPSEDLWRLRRHAKTVFCERLSTSLSHILKDVLFKETSEAREARAIEPSLVNKRGTWRGPLRRMLQRRTMKTLRKEEEEAERPASDSGTLVVVGERPFTNFRIDALSFTQETIRIARRLLASHIADVRSACVLALCDAQRVRMDAIKRTVARMELQHLVASLNDTKYLYDKLEGWLEPQNDDEEMQLDEQVGVGPRNWLFFDAEPCRVVHMETTEKASKGRMDVPEHTVTLSEFIEEAVCYFAKAQQQIVLYMSAWSMANLRLLDIGMNLFTHEWATDDRNTDGPKFTVRLWGENFTALREMLAEMVEDYVFWCPKVLEFALKDLVLAYLLRLLFDAGVFSSESDRDAFDDDEVLDVALRFWMESQSARVRELQMLEPKAERPREKQAPSGRLSGRLPTPFARFSDQGHALHVFHNRETAYLSSMQLARDATELNAIIRETKIYVDQEISGSIDWENLDVTVMVLQCVYEVILALDTEDAVRKCDRILMAFGRAGVEAGVRTMNLRAKPDSERLVRGRLQKRWDRLLRAHEGIAAGWQGTPAEPLKGFVDTLLRVRPGYAYGDTTNGATSPTSRATFLLQGIKVKETMKRGHFAELKALRESGHFDAALETFEDDGDVYAPAEEEES